MKHDTYVIHDEGREHVGCSCGWRMWLQDVPASVEGMARLVWLLERRDEHPLLAKLRVVA